MNKLPFLFFLLSSLFSFIGSLLLVVRK